MEKEIQDKITAAIDSAMAKFRHDPDIIYTTEKDRLKLKYAESAKLKNWAKSKECIYDNCQKFSIPKSHTIQKSSSMKLISENNNVLTPKFNRVNEQLEMSSVGIGEASTFPGFCEDHEKLFAEFENQKGLAHERHFVLQLYRTMCREIVIAEHQLDGFNITLENYITHKNEKMKEIYLKELGSDFLIKNDIKVKSFNLDGGDIYQKRLKDGLNSLKKYLESLQELKEAITNDIKKNRFQKIVCIPIDIDVVFPVCVAGRGNFKVKSKTKTKNIEVIFNVLPQDGKTYIIICGLKKFTKEIKLYVSRFANPLQLFSLVESLMVHGSDHWFIKPSVWNNIDSDRKNQILIDLHDISKNIGYEYAYSIFDDLRKTSIKLMDDNYDQLNEDLIELLEKERKKLVFSKPN